MTFALAELTRRLHNLIRAGTIAAVLFAGCMKVQQVAKPAAPLGSGEQVEAATTNANAAQTAADTAERERLAKVRANVDAAATAPNSSPASLTAGLPSQSLRCSPAALAE